jgi:hypothetical protein
VSHLRLAKKINGLMSMSFPFPASLASQIPLAASFLVAMPRVKSAINAKVVFRHAASQKLLHVLKGFAFVEVIGRHHRLLLVSLIESSSTSTPLTRFAPAPFMRDDVAGSRHAKWVGSCKRRLRFGAPFILANEPSPSASERCCHRMASSASIAEGPASPPLTA